MVRDVARAIDASLTPQQETRLTSRLVNSQAHEAYLRAKVAGQTKEVELHCKRAIQIDPSCVPAYDLLAYTYLHAQHVSHVCASRDLSAG